MLPEFDNSISGLTNQVLDTTFNAAARAMLEQIFAITNNPNSEMQRALANLDAEVKRLEEAGLRIEADNPVLEQTLRIYTEALVATQALVIANALEIEQSGQEVAPGSVTAKVFIAIATALALSGINPVTSLAAIQTELAAQGIQWIIPDALQIATSFVNSPEWIAKMEGWGVGWAELTRKTILNGIATGSGPQAIASKMRQLAQGLPLSAAENLTKTLQLTSFREASRALELVNNQFLEFKLRIATLDFKTCLTCIALHGTRLEIGERVDDHFRGRCEVPGNLISGAAISSLVSRHYNGDIVVLNTASGKQLPVTSNHPVLTDSGWLPAKSIRKGDNVISYGGSKGASVGVDPDENHIPTIVENIPASLGMARLGTMPISSQDFHGDGINGDVGIVWSNRFLRKDFFSSLSQPLRQKLFGGRNTEADSFFGLGDFHSMPHSKWYSSSGLLSSFHDVLLLLRSHLAGPQSVGLVNASPFNPSTLEPGAYNIPGYAKLGSQGVFGHSSNVQAGDGVRHRITSPASGRVLSGLDFPAFGTRAEQPLALEKIRERLLASMPNLRRNHDIIPGQIRFDPVVEVGLRRFSGHVYSLQSDSGWYSSNGIISHNCTEFYVVAGGPRFPDIMQVDSEPGKRNFVPYQNGIDWFNSLSPERQALQRSFLSTPAKFRAFQSGVSLTSFIGGHIDPLFGAQVIEQSLQNAIGLENAEGFYSRNQ